MYELVMDVESYPSFLPWCVGSEIHEQSETEIIASLSVIKAGFRQSFTTRNTLSPPNRIQLELVSGPFRSLAGEWQFQSLRSDASKISLNLTFRMAGPVGRLMEPLFGEMAESMVDAFVREAKKRYQERRDAD